MNFFVFLFKFQSNIFPINNKQFLIYSIFFKTSKHLLVWVLSHFVLSCLVLPHLVLLIFNIHFFNNYEYPFHTLLMYSIPRGHCVNQLEPVLLTYRIMYGNGLFWATQQKSWDRIGGPCIVSARQQKRGVLWVRKILYNIVMSQYRCMRALCKSHFEI